MESSSTPRVSVIISNYNYARFLEEAIESVLNQTYRNIEIVVVDDGSTDNSRQILEKFKSYPQIKIVLKENGGQASCFNAALPYLTGKYICLLDADDYFSANKVEKIVTQFNLSNAEIVYHRLWKVDREGKKISIVPSEKGAPPFSIEDIFSESVPLPSTTGITFSANFFRQIVPIPEEIFTIRADFYIHLMGAILNRSVSFLDSPLAFYRLHGKNLYGDKLTPARMKKDILFLEKVATFLKDKYQLNLSPFTNYNYLRNRIYFTSLQSRKEGLKMALSAIPSILKQNKHISIKRRLRRSIVLLVLALFPEKGLNLFNKIAYGQG
jgi:glycosyltransferase involved in cell wall biosynthesis